LGGLALAAGVALWIFLGPRIRWRQVEDAIRQSETAPSQATADSLVRLLRQGYPTPEQGRRILASLFRPQVTTRRAYPAGRRPTVALQLPFKVRRMGPGLVFEESLWADGESTDTSFYATGPYREGAHRIVALDHPLHAGQACEAEIRCHIWFATPGRYYPLIRSPVVRGVVRDVVARFNRNRAVRIGLPKTEEYECDFVVPIALVASDDGAAGEIELRSNPQFDMSVRSILARPPETWMGRTYSTSAGLLWCHGGATITYPALPLAVAFQAVLRLPDGREIPSPHRFGEPLRARAGAAGEFSISIVDFVAREAVGVRVPWIPGEYTGTLVLRPDPSLAYDDPAIEAIWNGTLEFPIRFTVTAEPNTAKQEQSSDESITSLENRLIRGATCQANWIVGIF
jgi:hypothetical protein